MTVFAHFTSSNLTLSFLPAFVPHADQPSLHCFSCCPTDLKSVSNVVPLEEGRGVVVRVFCVRGEEEAWVVRGGGDLELYSLEEEGWKMRGTSNLHTELC